MTIKAEVVADSINSVGDRLTTMVLKYPRALHSEYMTHRAFSRNAASSRAIPFDTMVANIKADPAMPVVWGTNNKGMRTLGELDLAQQPYAKQVWLDALEDAIYHASILAKDYNLHKEIVNRLLEPFMHIEVVHSATEHSNWFMLRDNEQAEKCMGMQTLAEAMLIAYNESTPISRGYGSTQVSLWHLPFIDDEERFTLPLDTLVKVSTARCARVSYMKHGNTGRNLQDDIELHDRLVLSTPPHLSPTEHQAVAKTQHERCGNFMGWTQYRKMLGGSLAFNSEEASIDEAGGDYR